MPKLNLTELEESAKKSLEGISSRLDFCSSDDESFVIDLIEAFPSILKTIRAYEEAIEKMRAMDETVLTCLCIEGSKAHKETDDFWRAKRDLILSDLDKKLSEI